MNTSMEETDNGIEEMQKAFDNYRMYLDFEEVSPTDTDAFSEHELQDGNDSSSSSKSSESYCFDNETRQKLIKIDSKTHKTSSKLFTRKISSISNATSVALTLEDETKKLQQSESCENIIKLDTYISWTKIIFLGILGSLVGVILSTASIIPISYSKLLGKNLVFGINNHIASFGYKFNNVFVDNK